MFTLLNMESCFYFISCCFHEPFFWEGRKVLNEGLDRYRYDRNDGREGRAMETMSERNGDELKSPSGFPFLYDYQKEKETDC